MYIYIHIYVYIYWHNVAALLNGPSATVLLAAVDCVPVTSQVI